jgi:adenylate kinase
MLIVKRYTVCIVGTKGLDDFPPFYRPQFAVYSAIEHQRLQTQFNVCIFAAMKNIVLFGPPGAGKGTQSAHIAEKFGLFHLSTGDIFRSNIKGGTELGILAKGFMDRGELVPDAVTIQMLESEAGKHPGQGYIFDGFPRTSAQAASLDAFLDAKGQQIDAMIALEVPEPELRDRLAGRAETSGRPDDANPEVIQNRIDVYNAETAPVAEHYRAQDKFQGVDGVGSIEEIFIRISEVLNSLGATA